MKKFEIFLGLLLLPFIGLPQKIDNAASFREVKSDNYLRFNYDNDFFSSTDQYYSQGYSFELASPWLKKNPANNLFIVPKNSLAKYGLAIEHIAFTPTSILSDGILYGDRPYAAAIMLKSFAISADTLHHNRISSALSIGIIGPGAFGKEMQTGIHDWTGNPKPLGWQHQVRNDLVLNYELSYEKQFLRLENFFSLQSNVNVMIGTLFTNISAGTNATLGILDSPFDNKKKKASFYIYVQPLVSAIGYDASLQGGLFNTKSPYTIPDSGIERLTAQINFGAVLKYKRLYLEYSRTKITREFETGKSAKWGGFKIGYEL